MTVQRANTALADTVAAYLADQPGTSFHVDQLIHLAPLRDRPRVRYNHELDDADTPGPTWAFGSDATGIAEELAGTRTLPDRDHLIRALLELHRSGRVVRHLRPGWTEWMAVQTDS